MKKPIIYLLVGVVALVTVGTYVVASNSKSSEEDTTEAIADQDESGLATQVPDEQSPSDPISVPTEIPVEDADVAEPEIKWATFTHPDLPGFSFEYLSDWSIEVKIFGDENDKGFSSKYSSSCSDNCMGVRLQKEDDKVDFIFVIAYDFTPGVLCSNEITYVPLDNKWYRISDSAGSFYSDSVSVNRTADDLSSLIEESQLYVEQGTSEDEWSLVEGADYRLCNHGLGNLLSAETPEEVDPWGGWDPIRVAKSIWRAG